MKKILYFLSSLMLVFTACDPMEDVYDELDQNAAASKRSFVITLQKADYESLKGKPNVPAYVNTKLYFGSEQEAGALIPILLNTRYAHLNDKDGIDVTYNRASPSTVSERVTYTLVDEDYALGGATFKNFDKFSQIETFLKEKYLAPVEGRLATLTFTWYNGNTNPTSSTITDTYYFTGGKWYDTYVVTEENYFSVDRNRNNAFTSSDEADYIPAALNKFLKEKIIGAKVGDMQYASFLVRYSSSSTLQQVLPFFYDGNNWVTAKSATLAFKKKNGTWVADPITRYSLTPADYTWISKQPNLGTADNRDNLEQFKSFYQRFTDDKRYWTQAQVIDAIGALLKERFPSVEVGSKFEVTYIVHTGPTGPTSLVLELNESGKYVEPED